MVRHGRAPSPGEASEPSDPRMGTATSGSGFPRDVLYSLATLVWTLAIDPGIRGLGFSLWDDGDLHLAGYVRNPYKTGDGPKEWRALYGAIFDRLGAVGEFCFERLEHLWIEVPRIYPAARHKGDQNDLVALAGVAGALTALDAVNITRVYPREWKGTIDPDVCIERIKRRLSQRELARVELPGKTLAHNVWDSVG